MCQSYKTFFSFYYVHKNNHGNRTIFLFFNSSKGNRKYLPASLTPKTYYVAIRCSFVFF